MNLHSTENIKRLIHIQGANTKRRHKRKNARKNMCDCLQSKRIKCACVQLKVSKLLIFFHLSLCLRARCESDIFLRKILFGILLNKTTFFKQSKTIFQINVLKNVKARTSFVSSKTKKLFIERRNSNLSCLYCMENQLSKYSWTR